MASAVDGVCCCRGGGVVVSLVYDVEYDVNLEAVVVVADLWPIDAWMNSLHVRNQDGSKKWVEI